MIKNGFHPAVFELSGLKANSKGVFSRVGHCFGNLLCNQNDNDVITNDFDTIIYLWHQLIKSSYNESSKSKSWKVLETVTSHLNSQIFFIFQHFLFLLISDCHFHF